MNLAKNRGYTLVETLVSVILGAFVIAGIALSLESGAFLTKDNRSQLYSANALREELETIRDMAYDDLVALGATSTFTNDQLDKLRDGTGTRSVVASFGDDIKKVTLTVAWTSKGGRDLSQAITTYVTRKGLNGE